MRLVCDIFERELLGDCVNNIVKWHYKKSSERNTTLTALLCGDNGLVYCLENVFLLGFKSARLFVRNHYLWDYFGKFTVLTLEIFA